MTVTSPSAAGSAGGRVTSSAAAPGGDRVGQVVVAVGALAGQRDEEVAGTDRAGVDRAAADGPVGAGQQPAAGQARRGRRR